MNENAAVEQNVPNAFADTGQIPLKMCKDNLNIASAVERKQRGDHPLRPSLGRHFQQQQPRVFQAKERQLVGMTQTFIIEYLRAKEYLRTIVRQMRSQQLPAFLPTPHKFLRRIAVGIEVRSCRNVRHALRSKRAKHGKAFLHTAASVVNGG